MVETGDVRYLLALDNYDELPEEPDGINEAWYNIYTEFSDIIGDNKAGLWMLKRLRLLQLQHRVAVHKKLLNLVSLLRIPEAVDIAGEVGIHIDLNNFDDTFQKAKTQLSKDENRLRSELNAEKPKTEKTDFDKLIITLEKWQGYQFDEKEMTLKKFANIYKQYRDGQDKV